MILGGDSAHTFWRVACDDCGCGTWCDDDGYGYEDEPGRQRAIDEWNRTCALRIHQP